MTLTTTHQYALLAWQFDYHVLTAPTRTKRAPAWLREKILRDVRRAAMRRAARSGIEAAGKASAAKARDEDRPGFVAIAAAVRRDHGYRDADCRRIATVLYRIRMAWGSWAHSDVLDVLGAYPARTSLPPPQWSRAALPASLEQWAAWATGPMRRAIGAAELDALVARVRANPSERISGYMAATILHYMHDPAGSDYSGCSGCESYAALAQRPDLWAELLARAPTGQVVWSADGRITAEQVYPHEFARAARLRAAGWAATMRLSDTVYTRPETPR